MELFYLGTHHTSTRWWQAGVPLFVSRRQLEKRSRLPQATANWALDSGGFTELQGGRWRTTEDQYVRDVGRYQEIGRLDWVAPQDWMCEPQILHKTGFNVGEHQWLTVRNFLRLRDRLGLLVVPVLQGWDRDDYLRCWQQYERMGVDLERERLVGVGTVCRRQNTAAAGVILRALWPLRLHGFGFKLTGLERYAHLLASSDSMAWSYDARRSPPLPGHEVRHKACNNCMEFALQWRGKVIRLLEHDRHRHPQLELEGIA